MPGETMLDPRTWREMEKDLFEWYEDMLDYMTKEFTAHGPPYPAVRKTPEELLEWYMTLDEADLAALRKQLWGEYGPREGEKMYQQMLVDVDDAFETMRRRMAGDRQAQQQPSNGSSVATYNNEGY